jgi:hypothetical protein
MALSFRWIPLLPLLIDRLIPREFQSILEIVFAARIVAGQEGIGQAGRAIFLAGGLVHPPGYAR